MIQVRGSVLQFTGHAEAITMFDVPRPRTGSTVKPMGRVNEALIGEDN